MREVASEEEREREGRTSTDCETSDLLRRRCFVFVFFLQGFLLNGETHGFGFVLVEWWVEDVVVVEWISAQSKESRGKEELKHRRKARKRRPPPLSPLFLLLLLLSLFLFSFSSPRQVRVEASWPRTSTLSSVGGGRRRRTRRKRGGRERGRRRGGAPSPPQPRPLLDPEQRAAAAESGAARRPPRRLPPPPGARPASPAGNPLHHALELRDQIQAGEQRRERRAHRQAGAAARRCSPRARKSSPPRRA